MKTFDKLKKEKTPKAPKEKAPKAPKEKKSSRFSDLKDRMKKDRDEEDSPKTDRRRTNRPAAGKPEKKERETKKYSAKILDRFKKNNGSGEDDGMDILTEVKEPFSFSNFFETHVVERAKRFKDTLEKRGILFFLFSPFQARGRLIAQMFILLIGIMFGVIPRASSMVNALQEQAYVSEIAGLSKKTIGSITITPAASSNYKRVHMIAFVVEGKNLPSDANKYDVHLARAYGASDWEDVTYSWTMYPVTDTQRILLVAIDQTKQASGYGAFDLYIQLSGEEVSEYARTPFEITLSSAQETTDLYDRTGIHLSALTESVCGTGEIAKKEAEFQDALDKYQVALEQAEAMPVDLSVAPTREDLETYCLANRVYRELDDDSTTEDILNILQVNDPPKVDYDVVITSNGIEYDSDFVSELQNDEVKDSEEDLIIFDAFENVDEAKKAVTAAMDNVNTEAVAWYNTLTSYKLILNQTIEFQTFPLYARCTNSIEDPINFIDIEPGEPSGSSDDGLSGTMTGDDDKKKPVSSGDEEPAQSVEPPVKEPAEEEEPVEEEPAKEEEPEEEPAEEEPVEKEEPEEEEPAEEDPEPIVSSDPADYK